MTNLPNSNAAQYADKTASYYAGMPFGALLVKTIERAQMASLQHNHLLEFELLRDYYSYSSTFMTIPEQNEIKTLLKKCHQTLSASHINPAANKSMQMNVSWVLSTQLFELKEKLFAYTSDLLNKASADDDLDIEKELEDI